MRTPSLESRGSGQPLLSKGGSGGRSLGAAAAWFGFLLLMCVALGWFVTKTLTTYGQNIEQRALITTAQASAASFSPSVVKDLTGTPADQTKASFAEVRTLLQRIRVSIADARFVYLMTQKDGEIVFLADGEDVNSRNYSPPGQVYSEATDTLRGVFKTKAPTIEGPVEDRWGDWVSGFGPIIDPNTGNVLAVLGVDVSAENWRSTISRFQYLGIGIGGLVAIAIMLLGWFSHKQQKLAQEVHYAASHDPLTGLFNRRVFVEQLQRRISENAKGDVAILYLDLDHFKDINDTLGHTVGDKLLCAASARVTQRVRRVDSVGRLGGDEFAIAIRGENVSRDAEILADRLIAALGEPFHIDGNMIRSGTSIGIAISRSKDDDAERLMSYADIALYQAKKDERGSRQFFSESLDSDFRHRVCMTAQLRSALDKNEFYVTYQPQLDLKTGEISGVEALVRWKHPERGVLNAGEFIPLAERSGLLVTLDRWVLREACRQGKAWLDSGVPLKRLAINISALHFRKSFSLESEIDSALVETEFPASLLELEITESGVMTASAEQDNVLSRLQAKGIRLSLDDFGTGYCSLDYLRRYPADRVKIAGTFVSKIVSDSSSAMIVKAICDLARQLGMISVAEEIETDEQLEKVIECGCCEAQGFYFAQPLEAEAVSVLLKRGLNAEEVHLHSIHHSKAG